MAITMLTGGGGRLPTPAAAQSASSLLDAFNALDAAGKTAFYNAIAPDHWTLNGEAVTSGAGNSVAGDTAFDVEEEDSEVWFLNGNSAGVGESWIGLLSGAHPPDATEPGIDPITSTGGRLPGAARPGTLVDMWNALNPAQRSAFRAAIKPAYLTAANQAARLALVAKAGDWCRQADAGVFRLAVAPATTNGNWDLVLPFAP